MKMQHFVGKQMLSMIREGDYAHAGEEESIDLVMNKIPKDRTRLVLDVGCGLGGTAKYIQDHGWGEVTGIDIEQESIKYAQEKYPDMEFATCSVEDAAKVLDKKFDLIYIFHALYAFPDKLAALTALRKVAKDNAQLVIFAFINRNNYIGSAFSLTLVSIPDLREMLESSGWKLTEVENLDVQHERWYMELVRRIADKRNKIINAFGEDAYNYMHEKYLSILQAIQDKKIGGTIVRAMVDNKK